MGVRVTVTGTREFETFLRRLGASGRTGVRSRVLAKIGRATERESKETRFVRGRGKAKALSDILSRRTGRLQDSISTDETGLPNRVEVGTSVEYGPIHELGLTVRRPIGPSKRDRKAGRLKGFAKYPRRPFLQPAAEAVIAEQAPKIMRDELERASRGQR